MTKQNSPPWWRHVALTALSSLLLLNLAACGATHRNQAKAAAKSATLSAQTAHFIGHMALSPGHGVIGSQVSVTGDHLPPNATFDLVWQTVKEHWVLKGQKNDVFDGRATQDVRDLLKQVQSDANGQLSATFTVPAGFGSNHTVSLVRDNVVNNQSLFKVDPQVSLESSQGPAGSTIRLTMVGIGAESYSNSWMLLYDNKFTGWISAVTTDGTAHVSIPATGGPGTHVISIIHGADTFPYLNTEQSPHPKPPFHLLYTVTSGTPVLPPPLDQQGLPTQPGTDPGGTGTAAWVSPATGPVGTPLVVRARNLPAGQTVDVLWSTVVGSRVTSTGWSSKTQDLGKTTVASDGTLTYRLQTPDDLGGAHAISIATSAGKVLASTGYTITPDLLSISPTHGPVDTTVTLHLQGVGWTDTANIYTLVYDNAYMGYACGFNSQGDVTIHLKSAGAPGWHFIDLYPAIYTGTDLKGTDDFRLPELTSTDHPGERLPALHTAIYVTGN